jgi:hypothetical protein
MRRRLALAIAPMLMLAVTGCFGGSAPSRQDVERANVEWSRFARAHGWRIINGRVHLLARRLDSGLRVTAEVAADSRPVESSPALNAQAYSFEGGRWTRVSDPIPTLTVVRTFHAGDRPTVEMHLNADCEQCRAVALFGGGLMAWASVRD